jgi:hypothetical protein
MRFLVLIREILVSSFDYNFLWRIVCIIFCRDFDKLSLRMNYMLGSCRLSNFFLNFLFYFRIKAVCFRNFC